MNLSKTIQDLEAQIVQLREAVEVLKRLEMGGGKRRGRKPAWMKEQEEVVAPEPVAVSEVKGVKKKRVVRKKKA